MAKVIAVANQKGGVGKTTTTASLGIGLARKGKKVLLIDADPQGNLTECLGFQEPDEMKVTIADAFKKLLNEQNEEKVNPQDYIIHNDEGVDLIPANISLADIELMMVAVTGREFILEDFVEPILDDYDYILIDCMPSLGIITVNALAAADSVLIPVKAEYLPVKGLVQLLKSINRTQKRINTRLAIEGILFTMVDSRTNFSRDIMQNISDIYKGHIRVFENRIPVTVRAAETSAQGVSIYEYDARNKASIAYLGLTEEVLGHEA